MPTYEYRCNACGKNFEYQQRMSDDDLVTCEACGQPKLEKLISRTAFTLKGSGWYRDLYSSPPAQSTDASKPAASPSESKSDSGSSSGSSDGGSSSSGGGASEGGSSSGSSGAGTGGTTSSAARSA